MHYYFPCLLQCNGHNKGNCLSMLSIRSKKYKGKKPRNLLQHYSALFVKKRNRLLKISHVFANIIGLPTPMLSKIIDHAILKKARAVATESDHPFSTFFHVLLSQRRYRCIKCKTSRHSRSFVPVAIRMLNAK